MVHNVAAAEARNQIPGMMGTVDFDNLTNCENLKVVLHGLTSSARTSLARKFPRRNSSQTPNKNCLNATKQCAAQTDFLLRTSVQLFRLEVVLGDGCGDVVVVPVAGCGAM